MPVPPSLPCLFIESVLPDPWVVLLQLERVRVLLLVLVCDIVNIPRLGAFHFDYFILCHIWVV